MIKCHKNVNILEFCDNIWNRHEKCIQVSTNVPGIDSLIHEIHTKLHKFEKAKQSFAQYNQCLRSNIDNPQHHEATSQIG